MFFVFNKQKIYTYLLSVLTVIVLLFIDSSTIKDEESIEILSVHGEEQSKRLSENVELNNIDVIWSSSYTRAKATAKYIANNNKNPGYPLDSMSIMPECNKYFVDLTEDDRNKNRGNYKEDDVINFIVNNL